jgi:hypothetical protein
MNGDQPMIDLLCSYGAARNVQLMAHYGDVRTAAAVFAANPALADDPGALASAAGNGHEGFVRLMLRHQPDLATRLGVGGRTRELTELLFAHGMNPSFPDWLRITPLHRFAESGDVENAAIFIDHGADLHARDEELSSTPLGYAAKFGKILMVELLLRRGARPNLPDDPPWATPLAWATRRGDDRLVQLLKQYEEKGTLPMRTLEQYETLVQDLVDAYDSGDADALRRLADHFQPGRQATWEQLRRHTRQRLGKPPDSESERDTLSLPDARLLIARSHGFESWAGLTKDIESATEARTHQNSG